jgi:superfamily II DNA/RNA helicase
VQHRVLIVLREDKDRVLVELASGAGRASGSASGSARTLVFCRTRAYAERIAEMLSEAGLRVVSLHGDLSQAKRERNLARFSSGKASVLVATDVAARGIHVDDVDLVLQADPPDDSKTYVHRAGRTGRAGKDGLVITVIPRTRQKRTRELLESAGIEPDYFGDFEPAGAA